MKGVGNACSTSTVSALGVSNWTTIVEFISVYKRYVPSIVGRSRRVRSRDRMALESDD
jgi:hypothetical protein